MGKWSGLKGAVEKAPVDSTFQSHVNQAKVENYAGFTTTMKAMEFCKVRDRKEVLEAEIRGLNIQLEALSQMMIDDLESDGINSFRLLSGDSLSIKDEPYCSVAEKDVFIAWIKANGMEDLLTVHYMTLSSMTKNRLESGENPPPGIKVFLKQSITRRKGKD